MNLLNQVETSGPSIRPAKRRRGRPRKDSSLKPAESAHTPVSEGVKEYAPQRTDQTRGSECMVGQAVSGVVAATFDSGYLLTVRIGDSNTNLRGVVFKPEHCLPITAENDVAPHVRMIRTSDDDFTTEKDQPTTVRDVEDAKEPLFGDGTGRMAELLKALQENAKETIEPDPKNEVGDP